MAPVGRDSGPAPSPHPSPPLGRPHPSAPDPASGNTLAIKSKGPSAAWRAKRWLHNPHPRGSQRPRRHTCRPGRALVLVAASRMGHAWAPGSVGPTRAPSRLEGRRRAGSWCGSRAWLPSALCLQVPQGFMWEDTAPSPVWLTDTVRAAQGDPTSGRPFPGRVLRETVVLSRAALPEGGLQAGRGSQTVGWILRAGRGVTAPWDVPGEAGGGSGMGAAPGIRAPAGTRLRAGQPAGSPSPDSLATGHQEGLQQEWQHQPGAGLSGPVDPLLPLPWARSCLLGNGWE